MVFVPSSIFLSIIMKKGGFVVSKVEMTKLWKDDAFIPVTIVKLLTQKIARVKTIKSD